MSVVEELKAYREIVDDWEQFIDTITSAAPKYLRVNRFQTDLEEAEQIYAEHNLPVEKNAHFDNLYRWRGESRRPGQTLLHWLGYYYILDVASLLPVRTLSPPPGAAALDLCAAPGGKTLYLAELVGPDGEVIANEPVTGRRISLQANVQRFSVPNVYITGYRGQSVPESEKFEYILVDAPCSGEGAERYPEGDFELEPRSEREAIVNRQSLILNRAYEILAPGGRLVYSTCTFSPRENEAVVDGLLESTDARLIEPDLELPSAAGVACWKDAEYNSEVKKMRRFYPHHLDGGGMVLALITKPRRAG